MLRELKIENLAIIRELNLEFGEGLIVLTGETGAGKSIILDGINLLIGEKVSTDMIRTDADYLLAEGVFEISKDTEEALQEMDIEVEDREVIVRRELDKTGKGKAYLNGKRVPVTTLREVMNSVVDLVGQHAHQMLLEKKHHLNLVDKFLDEAGKSLKEEIVKCSSDYAHIESEIIKSDKIKEEAREKKELYEYQFREISEMELIEGEDETLEEEYKKLFNAGKIQENLSKAHHLLKENEMNVMSMLTSAKNSIEYISKYGKEYEEIFEKIESCYYEVEEAVYALENTMSDSDIDEGRLNKVVDRLDKINSLKKKYGFTIKDIIDYGRKIEEKLSLLDSNNIEEKRLQKEKEELLKKYKEKEAENLFKSIDDNYKALKAEAIKSKVRRSIITELKTGSVWYVPGGKSTIAQMISDANGKYIYAADKSAGSLSLPFEKVLDDAGKADVWMYKYDFHPSTMRELMSDYNGYCEMKAFKSNEVYGADCTFTRYYEEASFHPDRLLRDMIIIIHPDLRLGKLRYYHKLEY